jgi:hypothetical protein
MNTNIPYKWLFKNDTKQSMYSYIIWKIKKGYLKQSLALCDADK